jgi:hypothetical protein
MLPLDRLLLPKVTRASRRILPIYLRSRGQLQSSRLALKLIAITKMNERAIQWLLLKLQM